MTTSALQAHHLLLHVICRLVECASEGVGYARLGRSQGELKCLGLVDGQSARLQEIKTPSGKG